VCRSPAATAGSSDETVFLGFNWSPIFPQRRDNRRLAVSSWIGCGCGPLHHHFTIVLAVDGINDDLRRMIQYLNAVTAAEVQVLAFELAGVADGDIEMLLPRIFGDELARAKTGIGATTSQPSWSRHDYLGWLSTNRPELRPGMQALLDDADQAAYGSSTAPPRRRR